MINDQHWAFLKKSFILDAQRSLILFLSFYNLSAEGFLNYLLANYAFLNFDLLSVRSLNFPKISASFLIGPFFIISETACIDILEQMKIIIKKNVTVRLHYNKDSLYFIKVFSISSLAKWTRNLRNLFIFCIDAFFFYVRQGYRE